MPLQTVKNDLLKLLKNPKLFAQSTSITSHYSSDESYYQKLRSPDFVIFPENVTQISQVQSYCYERDICVIPFGQGSGLEGGVNPLLNETRPVITLDLMKNMDKINQVFGAPDRYVQVQPGVTREALNEHIRDTGLFFPVDPGANASLGGMAATSASGTNAVRYGTMKENTINMQVVLPNGEIIHTAGENRSFIKSSAGYNLTELFVGSEGTLGTISEVTLRLHPQQDYTAAAKCFFPGLENATETAEAILSIGLPVSRIEILDELSLKAVLGEDCTFQAALFFELASSSEAYLGEQTETIQWLCTENQGMEFGASSDRSEMKALWAARHKAYYSMIHLFQRLAPSDNERRGYATDVCVPVSKIGAAVKEAKELVKSSKYLSQMGGVIGHIGDGNFHINFGIDTTNQQEMQEIKYLSEEIARLALKYNGTVTGEHGIGIGKIGLLREQVGPATHDLMKTIKRTIDPKNIMNPGKIF